LKKNLEKTVHEYLKTKPSLFLVDISIDAKKIIITMDGDNGVKISDCVKIGKYVKENLDDELENYSFEVTSVGLNSPISTQRQFLKNINKKLGIQSLSGENFKGHLCEVNDNNVKIEWISRESKIKGKGKISVKKNKSFSYNEIKQAKIIIEF
jgi:ribosome maturation factor RimP